MTGTYHKLSIVRSAPNFRDAAQVVDALLEEPTEDQVLIRTAYAGVNATDVFVDGVKMTTGLDMPYDCGMEALGIIESVGQNITKFKVGDPVVIFTSYTDIPRCYSQYIYAKEEDVLKVPEFRPEFIALLESGLTAAIGLDEAGRVKAGDKVLITAAAGGTGHIAVQWAKKRGAHVIGMTSSEEKAKLLKELGSDRVINYKIEDLDAVLTKEYPNGVDVVWETIGGQVFETLLKHLAPMGRMLIIGYTSSYSSGQMPAPVKVSPAQLTRNNQSLNGFFIFPFKHLFQQYVNELTADAIAGKLKVVLDLGKKTSDGQFQGVGDVARALEYLHSRKSLGKVAICFRNTE